MPHLFPEHLHYSGTADRKAVELGAVLRVLHLVGEVSEQVEEQAQDWVGSRKEGSGKASWNPG